MRQIDADALKDSLVNAHINRVITFDINTFRCVMNCIDEVPTLEQPEHITTAEWIIIKSKAMQFDEYVCNRCNTYALEIMGKSYASRYCPYCGAFMNGVDGDCLETLHKDILRRISQ